MFTYKVQSFNWLKIAYHKKVCKVNKSHDNILAIDMPIHDSAKYSCHGSVSEFIDGDCVQVTQEPRSYRIPTTSWWAHSTNNLNVY